MMKGEQHEWKRNVKWDVTHEWALKMVKDKTFHFNPALSYETTGYRPINEEQGLDFIPLPFRLVGETRVRTGRYTDLHIGSRAHREWWLNQHKICNEGFVHNNYRVTGDNYFFLNFYTMLIHADDAKAGSGRDRRHPNFWAVHYEWFHYIELAEILGYDCVGLKSRGVGFSEIGACLGVRPYTTVPNFNALYIASYEPFLTGKGIIQKCWDQLHWLNQNTEGGMRRIRQVVDQELHKRASKATRQREESGHMAQISGQVVDKPHKLRGDRTERIVFEESGSNPTLSETFAVSEALVVFNGKRIGTRIIFGTGGDSETVEGKKVSVSGLHGLEKMFLSPRTYGILPYLNSYNNSGVPTETGYFVPAWRTVVPAMDSRGVANEEEGKKYYIETKRIPLQSDPSMYLKHCAEFCFTYEEALSRKGSNRFNQEKLANQRLEIEIHKSTPKPERGKFEWVFPPNDKSKPIGARFVPTPNGYVELTEHPEIDPASGMPVKHLYVGGIDSIDVGADESIVGDAGSKFCLLIKKRSYGLTGNVYVCKYLQRPDKVRDAYEQAMMILMYYRCEANIEATRIGIIAFFRDRGMITYLMNRPRYALEGQSNNRNMSNLIGTQASPKMIEYGIDLVRDYVEDYCENIIFADMVVQLLEYSDELKGKYDIVAAMQMCEIGDTDMMGIVAKREEPQQWRDFGFYKDPTTGHRKYGAIPTNEDYGTLLFGK